MRIRSVDVTPFHSFPYFNAASGGGTETRQCSLFRAKADALPPEIQALVIASDLQGVVGSAPSSQLLGVGLADELAALSATGRVPPLNAVGAVLAGDLFSAPRADKRGASGDVRDVWLAFASRFRFVVGVAGNHDTFGTPEELAALKATPGVHLLDGDVANLDGVVIGGVGGISGDPAKPQRRHEREFLRALRRVVDADAKVVVLHHGPDADRGRLRGSPEIRQALDRSGPRLVICGHVYWPEPLVDIRGGAQVLNADSRVVVVTRGD